MLTEVEDRLNNLYVSSRENSLNYETRKLFLQYT